MKPTMFDSKCTDEQSINSGGYDPAGENKSGGMRKQLLTILLTSLVIVFTNYLCNTDPVLDTNISFEYGWDTITPLPNPDKGWYHHLLDNRIDRYGLTDTQLLKVFPGLDHFYLRLAWAFLEPEEGKYDWSLIDNIVVEFVPKGYKIAFRITSSETGTVPFSVPVEIDGIHYATPHWVREAGARGVIPERMRNKYWIPDWSDSIYLEKLNNFHRAFAERYDGKYWVRYIDVGSIGDWGEGHTSSSTNVPPTVQDVKANIDVYLKNYKNTQIVVTDDMLYWRKNESDVRELYEYAIGNGITLRDDSPLVNWYVQRNFDTWSVSHPHFFDPLYLDKPVIFELQHYHTVKRDGNWRGKNGQEIIPELGVSGATIFKKSMELIRPTYIGYHGYIEEFYNDNPNLAGELLNRCGYWYFPVSASFPLKMNKSGSRISFKWLNKGVAPAYKAYSILFYFESVKGEDSFYVVLDSGNKNWLPGIVKDEIYNIEIPPHITQGEYVLKFKIKNTSSKYFQRDVAIGLNRSKRDENHFYILGKVII
jgi:hypothetical protein